MKKCHGVAMAIGVKHLITGMLMYSHGCGLSTLEKKRYFYRWATVQLYGFCATAVEDVVTNAKAIENSTTYLYKLDA
jgi:hypothetical protein